MEASISLKVVKSELESCLEYAKKCGWLISDIDESNLSFNVEMTSPLDGEVYILNVVFSDYPELPLILDFIDPETKKIGSRNAFPDSKDSFFHKRNPPFICSPCSRKAYGSYSDGVNGPHREWAMIGWRNTKQTGGLIDIPNILRAIFSRISDEKKYNKKRMR